MRLADLDESYPQDHYFIGAVVGEWPAVTLTKSLDAIAESARSSPGLSMMSSCVTCWSA